ncbi:11940_t:CDS:2 [Dentiscutata erythropus]|uniref:11940_t:CDS:1 n=1 Tax=Dentiscutata erythropus TaxID=1348616 RepID=A0A9N9A4J7_9GLOM|nr:11940_t:CDS:2 [Dentiscutata erythropus]
MTFEQARKTIGQLQTASHLELPVKPEEIPIDIAKIIPFALPLEDNTRTAAIVKALRLIFNFSQLPDSYFVTVQIALPHNPNELKEKLPSPYFDLPPEKIDLPSTPKHYMQNLGTCFFANQKMKANSKA